MIRYNIQSIGRALYLYFYGLFDKYWSFCMKLSYQIKFNSSQFCTSFTELIWSLLRWKSTSITIPVWKRGPICQKWRIKHFWLAMIFNSENNFNIWKSFIFWCSYHFAISDFHNLYFKRTLKVRLLNEEIEWNKKQFSIISAGIY